MNNHVSWTQRRHLKRLAPSLGFAGALTVGVFATQETYAAPVPKWLVEAEAGQFERKTAFMRSETPLWGNARLRYSTNGLDQFNLSALSEQSGVLMTLRDWRNTFKGTGVAPLRKFNIGGGGSGGLNFEIGARPLPMSELAGLGGGTAPSMGFTFGRISMGTTAPIMSMNKSLKFYDKLMAPKDPFQAPQSEARDETTMTWMMAKPFESKRGLTEFLYVRGHKDTTPGQVDNKRFLDGSLWGTRARFTPLTGWTLKGEFINSEIETRPDAATNWKWSLDGSMKMPLGRATVAASMNNVDSNFATFMNPSPQLGRRVTDFSVQDNIAKGNFSGAIRYAVNRTARKDLGTLASGTSAYAAIDDVNANFSWKLSRRVSLTAQHVQKSTADDYMPGGTYLSNNTSTNTSDVGVQVQLAKPLTLTMGVGRTSFDSQSRMGATGEFKSISLKDDSRLRIGLQRNTRRARLGFTFLTNGTGDSANRAGDTSSHSLLFEGERQINRCLKLKGSWKLAQQDFSAQQIADNRADRSIEAMLDFKKRGQLKLRYADWNLDHSLAGLLQETNTSEYGLEYSVGIGESTRPGFGFTFGAYKHQVPGPDKPNLKISLNYR